MGCHQKAWTPNNKLLVPVVIDRFDNGSRILFKRIFHKSSSFAGPTDVPNIRAPGRDAAGIQAAGPVASEAG